jgi:hypothetical protein
MDQNSLVNEQIEAGAEFLSEFCKYLPVRAAFWLKDSEEGGWYLYVASEQITDENFDVVYGEVGRIVRRMQHPWLGVFQVKVIGADDPLAKAARDLQQRYPRRLPGRFPGRTFGGRSFAEVYLYAVPLPAPAP